MWNDKETDIDLLGHEKISQTIIEIINDKHLRPLTIGVYGDWGVGKSSIISILQKNIAEKNKIGTSKAHCIVFNGWLFQGYEDAKTALMETVVTELAALHLIIEKLKNLQSP
jgi:predicted KAP-like P-loop ATPase